MKRIIALFLVTLMLLAIVPFSAFDVSAEDITYDQGVKYTLSDCGTYYIVTGCDSSLITVVIPDTINGLPVSAIGASVGYYHQSLTSIEIPNSIKTIGSGAFSGCNKLESITVAKGNETYHSSGNCLIETATKTLILGCKNSVIPTDGSVTSIGYGAFFRFASLKSIKIPESITSIGGSAFYGCYNLTSIEIPKSVTSIGDYAFCGCAGLTSMEIPESVTSIGDEAFYYCENLRNIEIPESVTSIGDYTFYGCTSLTDIYCEAKTQPNGWDLAWNYGCNATVHWGETKPDEPDVMIGDINENGDIDSMDYVLLKRAYFGTYTLDDITVGDIDENGEIGSMDYVYLRRAYFGTYVIK